MIDADTEKRFEQWTIFLNDAGKEEFWADIEWLTARLSARSAGTRTADDLEAILASRATFQYEHDQLAFIRLWLDYRTIPADEFRLKYGKCYESHDLVAMARLCLTNRTPQSASERTDNARLLWLETLLKHCPHAELTWNDDADEGPLGWRLLVESCYRLDLRAPTLEALIDLGMKADPDEDGDVVANATDATSDRKAHP